MAKHHRSPYGAFTLTRKDGSEYVVDFYIDEHEFRSTVAAMEVKAARAKNGESKLGGGAFIVQIRKPVVRG